MNTHPNLLLDELVTLRLSWKITALLAVKAAIRKTSFQGMIEYAMMERLKGSKTAACATPFPPILASHHKEVPLGSKTVWRIAARKGLRGYALPVI